LLLLNPVTSALQFLELDFAETAEMDAGKACQGLGVWLSLLQSVLCSNVKAVAAGGSYYQQDRGVNPAYQSLTGLERKTGQDS